MRTPFGIVRGEPAEGAIATAAARKSTSERTARFQSAIRTKEAATRFIGANVTTSDLKLLRSQRREHVLDHELHLLVPHVREERQAS